MVKNMTDVIFLLYPGLNWMQLLDYMEKHGYTTYIELPRNGDIRRFRLSHV
jgi:hypothetical protein